MAGTMGTRGLLLRSTIVAALGGLLFGFDTAVISGTTDALRKVFELTSQQLGFTVASALIGTILGAIAVGRPADMVGRRTTLIVMAVFYFVSAVGSAFPWDWYSFLGFRFLGGLAVGGASVVSPLYIAEISPARVRGRLVAVQQFNIVLGILLAFFSNYLLAGMELGGVTWRWMFGVEAFPAAAFFFLLFGIPQSPRWLVAKGRVEEAGRLLALLGTDTGSVQQEIDAIRDKAPKLAPANVRARYGVHHVVNCPDLDAAQAMLDACNRISEKGDSAGGVDAGRTRRGVGVGAGVIDLASEGGVGAGSGIAGAGDELEVGG